MGEIVRLVPRSEANRDRLAQLEHYANSKHRRFRWRWPGTRSGKVLAALIAGFALYFVIAAVAGVAVQSKVGKPLPMEAGPIAGVARVVDGDTIAVGKTRVRFFGIDAPEASQNCRNAAGAAYPCGEAATAALRDMLQTHLVTCERRDIDRYGRIVAICQANGRDLAAALVEQGYALAYRAYSTRYVEHEARAKAAHLGMWSGSFEIPSDNRRRSRQPRVSFLDATGPAAP